jgi:hypothetical protein
MCGYFTGAQPETQAQVKPETKPVIQEETKKKKEEEVVDDDEEIQLDEEFMSSYAKKRLRELSENDVTSRVHQFPPSQNLVDSGVDADRYATGMLNKVSRSHHHAMPSSRHLPSFLFIRNSAGLLRNLKQKKISRSLCN